MAVPEDFYDVTIVWRLNSGVKDMTTQIGVTIPLDPASKSPAEVADEIYELLNDEGGPCDPQYMSASWRFVGVSVSLMTPTGPLVGQHFETVVGTGSASSAPPNCAVLISKQTAAGGRRNRGRMFIPPLFPSEATIGPDGVIAGIDLEALQGIWTVFLGRLLTADYAPMLYHQTGDQTPTAITGLLVNGLIATQRRRLRS